MVKRAWDGEVKGWVTYREVILDIVRVRPKHGEKSYGDCKVSKQDFQAFEKNKAPSIRWDGAHGPREKTCVAHQL